MRVLLSGSTGLLGSALLHGLRQQGFDFVRLVRPSTRNPTQGPAGAPDSPVIGWDPLTGTLDDAASGADAVVHLAGASIGEGRWTPSRKQILRESRVAATRKLVDSLARLARPPRVFLAASAIGYYGNRGDETLSETSAPGRDFLADLCQEWEAESARAASFGARVVILRFGIILAKQGGALPRMTLPFRLGVGGRLGSGQQWMSWVALEDVLGAVAHALSNGSLSGAVNVVSPNPVRNVEFTATLGRVLHRPTLFPAPAFALRLMLGEMADGLLLSSQRVLPEKLRAISYPFIYQQLEPALRGVLNG